MVVSALQTSFALLYSQQRLLSFRSYRVSNVSDKPCRYAADG